MIKAIFKILFRLQGWKLNPVLPKGAERSVMVAAPHTSNWDFVFAIAALEMLGLNVKFTIKKEFNKPLIGWWMQSLGALWIDRSPKEPGKPRKSMVEAMVEELDKRPDEQLAVVVTPEGTRSRREQWKTGFYHVAKQAGLPIALAYMDYAKKETGVGMCIWPGEDMDADMAKIMEFYRDFTPKFPEKFSLDLRWSDEVKE